MSSISRIAVALERIATALEKQSDPVMPEGQVRIDMDGLRSLSGHIEHTVTGR